MSINRQNLTLRRNVNSLLTLIQIAIILFSSQCSGRIGQATQFDGVTPSQYYNSYLKFSGNNGFLLDEQGMSEMNNYTLSLWFRFHQTPKESDRQMHLVTFRDAFECYFSKASNIQCTGFKGGQSLVSSANVRVKNWYILLLKSVKNSTLQRTELKIFELSKEIFSSTNSTSFFPPNYSNLSIQTMIIGINSDFRSYGFIGNIRNIRLYESYYDDATVYRYQFNYLYPNRFQKISIMLNDIDDYSNYAGIATGMIVGEGPITKEIDSFGVFQCTTKEQSNYNSFQKEAINLTSEITFKQYSLEGTQYFANLHTEMTFQTWIYRSKMQPPSNDEILLYHSGLLRASFNMSDYPNLMVENLAQPSQIVKVKVPFYRWIFLQIQSSSKILNATIFESDSYQIQFSQITFASPKQPTANKFVTLFQGFNGLSLGFKYFKTANPTNKVHYFTNTNETNQTALLYILFNSTGLVNGTSFKNFALQKSALTLDQGSYFKFSKSYFRDNSTDADYGYSINTELKFDGYTCTDTKDKLFFPRADSYANALLKLTEPTDSYTVEFWVKSTQGLTGENYMISISDNPRTNSIQYFSILQESDGTLSCYPSLTQSKVKYIDYVRDSRSWVHITCIYDSLSRLMKGFLFQNNIETQFYSEISSPKTLESKEYLIYINSNSKTLIRGAQSSYYYEIRLWLTSRSLTDIQYSRYQQQDIIQPSLAFYVKLSSGVSTSSQYDLEYIQKTPVYGNNLHWMGETTLFLCPLGTFKPEGTDINCYREFLNYISILVYKQNNSYVVSPFFSDFKNQKFRYAASFYYNFSWLLQDIQAPLSFNSSYFKQALQNQSTSQILYFRSEYVAENSSGRYSMSLLMQDKFMFQEQQTKTFQLVTMKCANIFESQSKNSYVIKDLEVNINVDDAVFSYDYTDCEDYKLDQNAMTFTLDGYGELPQSDHNLTGKQFTLKYLYQQNLQINDYFHLRIKGVWKNTKNQYDQVNYYLIYACRIPSKVVVHMKANSIILFKGQTLNLSGKAEFINIPTSLKERTFTTQWLCPDALSVRCSNLKGAQTANITYDSINNIFYEFWIPQTYSFQAVTNYFQIDGVNTSTKSVEISWLDLNQNITIKPNNVINKLQPFSWQYTEDIKRLDMFTIKWKTQPAIDSKCYLNYDNQTQFVVNSSCFNDGQQYTVSSMLIHLPTSAFIVNSELSFTAPKSPWGGKFVCNSTSGSAFKDVIKCTADAWQSANKTLKYQFFSKNANGEGMSVQSPVQNSNEFSSVYPPTSEIIVKVIDIYEQATLASFIVNITYKPESVSPPPSTPPQTPQTPPSPPSSPQTPPTPPSSPQTPPTPTTTPPSQNQSTGNNNTNGQSSQNNNTNQTGQNNSNNQSSSQNNSSSSGNNSINNQQGNQNTQNNATSKSMQELILLSKQLNISAQTLSTEQLQVIKNDIASGLKLQASQISKLQTIDEKKFVGQSTVQIIRDLTENPKGLNGKNLNQIQSAVNQILSSKETLETLYFDNDFKNNFFNIQSNVLRALGSINSEVVPSQNSSLNNISLGLRQNLAAYESFISPKLLDGQNLTQGTSAFQFQVMKMSKTGLKYMLQDYSIISKEVNYTFPLSRAEQPSSRQSFTAVNFKLSPFLGQNMINQTQLTNTTLFFSYRDENGEYLNSTFLKSRITMNFSYPTRQNRDKIKGTLTCAYASVEDTYWKNESCATLIWQYEDIITCKCKHMSYYTLVDSSFNQTTYEQEQAIQSGNIYELPIYNWIFFIPAGYIILIFIFGVIFTVNKDHTDFRFITDQEEVNDEQLFHLKESNGQMSDEHVNELNAIIFHRKMVFQSLARGRKNSFCNNFRLFIIMLHPLFSLKNRFDMTLPRVYKFLILFTKIVIMFGLCFYFLRDFENFEDIAKEDQEEMQSKFIYLAICLVICSLVLIPTPLFMLRCCRSKYYLVQQDKITDLGSNHEEPVSSKEQLPEEGEKKDENSAQLQKEQKPVKKQPHLQTTVQIDPSIPMSLLFLLKAASHDKIINGYKTDAFNFSSGYLRGIGKKLTQLEKEQMEILKNEENLMKKMEEQKKLDDQEKQAAILGEIEQQEESKHYVNEEQKTEMDLIKNSARQKIDNSSDRLPPKKISGDKSDSSKRLITFEKEEEGPTLNISRHSRKSGTVVGLGDISLEIDKDRGKYMSIRNIGNSSVVFEMASSHKDRSQRSRISQTEEEEQQEERKSNRRQFEGGQKEILSGGNSGQKSESLHIPASSKPGSITSFAHGHALYEDFLQQESGISIDSNIIAAEEKKELVERRGLAILCRALLVLFLLCVNLFVCGVVGYYYYHDRYYYHSNAYVWAVIFFGAQLFGFFVIDIIIIMLTTLIVTACCCKKHKVCLARLMNESLYVYEDFKYVVYFTKK